MSKPLTFEVWWKSEDWGNCEGILDAKRAWNARQPEIDAHKADVAYWRNIAVQADEIIEEIDVEIERLTRERDAAEAAALERAAQIICAECHRGTCVEKVGKVIKHFHASAEGNRHRHCDAHEILESITPDQSSALEQVKAEARLEEARWHNTNWNPVWSAHRIAELEAAAGKLK